MNTLEMNTYVVKCAIEDTVLGYVGMTAALAASLDRREHDEATWDVMFVRVDGEPESWVWETELVSPITSEARFDSWMGRFQE